MSKFVIPRKAGQGSPQAPGEEIDAGAPQASPQPAPAPGAGSARQFIEGAAMVATQSTQRPLKPVRINIDLSPDLHRRIKQRALDLDTSIAEYIRSLINRDMVF